MTAEIDTDNVHILRDRVAKQASIVCELLDRLIINPNTDELDKAYGEAVAKLRKAERDFAAAARKGSGQ